MRGGDGRCFRFPVLTAGGRVKGLGGKVLPASITFSFPSRTTEPPNRTRPQTEHPFHPGLVRTSFLFFSIPVLTTGSTFHPKPETLPPGVRQTQDPEAPSISFFFNSPTYIWKHVLFQTLKRSTGGKNCNAEARPVRNPKHFKLG